MSNSTIVTLPSPLAFGETLARLKATFADKGITIFATIDHQSGARDAGLSMPPATVIVFGNPKAGTPLMLANLQVAVDLPLKVLVSEPEPGKVLVTYRAAASIGEAHGLPAELIGSLAYAEEVIKGAISG